MSVKGIIHAESGEEGSLANDENRPVVGDGSTVSSIIIPLLILNLTANDQISLEEGSSCHINCLHSQSLYISLVHTNKTK